MSHKYLQVAMDEKSDSSRCCSEDSKSDQEHLLIDEERRCPHLKSQQLTKTAVILHITLILLNLMIGTAILLRSSSRTCSPPASSRYELSALKSIIRDRAAYWNLTLGDRSPYTLPPSPEVDAEWKKITAPPGDVGFVMVEESEMKRMNLSSVSASDGSGYLVTLDVFHQLHCLDHLRHTIYNATYYHMSATTHTLHDDHVAHCIDSLRLSLQCHADTSVIPFVWRDDYPLPWPDFRSTHSCRNFEDILDFANENYFDAKKNKALFVHPVLGAERPLAAPMMNVVDDPEVSVGETGVVG